MMSADFLSGLTAGLGIGADVAFIDRAPITFLILGVFFLPACVGWKIVERRDRRAGRGAG